MTLFHLRTCLVLAIVVTLVYLKRPNYSSPPRRIQCVVTQDEGGLNFATVAAGMDPRVIGCKSQGIRGDSNPPVAIDAKDERIIMATYIFGGANKKYLRMFAESVRYSGIDVAIVGDHPPPFELPPNVRHVSITWDGLVDRVRHKVFGGEEPGELRRAPPYKVVDMKPLFAYLFPEVVEGYDWWGHIDNDMIIGNVTHFLPQKILKQADIICPIGGEKQTTWGPFMLYRNSKVTNELFFLSDRLKEILGAYSAVFFDEWGLNAKNAGLGNLEDIYKSTMAGIVDHQAERLGLRYRNADNITGRLDVWDGNCHGHENPKLCALCIFRQGAMTTTRKDDETEMEETMICHYQSGKAHLEKSLDDPIKLERMVQSGEFQASFPEGFDYIIASD